jgi:predicted enzyme related to lactoylglutathione lyase
MMPAPNLFLVYVRDAAVATAFYAGLFEITPAFVSPRYVAFEVAPGVLFAVWTGRADQVTPDTARNSEVGLMVPRSTALVDDLYARWTAQDVTVVEEPHDDVFGRTFVIADPDGNLIRVSPAD